MTTLRVPEIEGKILDIDSESLIARIYELNWLKVFKWELSAQWLVNPYNWEKLRVRQEWDKIFVEHKESIKSTVSWIKTNQETGFEAVSFDEVIATLDKVWLQKHGLKSVKYRVSYILEWIGVEWHIAKLDIDTYSDLQGETIPTLLEIEAASQEIVIRVAELLGYHESDLRDFGPVELLKHYYPNKEII